MTDRDLGKPVLVIGGTGKTGKRVASRLAQLGIPVRIGSRSAAPAFDWNDPAGWQSALDGVSAAYITYYPDLAVPGSGAAIQRLTRLALEMGVKRLVLLSGRGEPEAQHAEAILQASGADWTIVRASWFMQNFSESLMAGPILSGALALPAGAVREPFIDADDIADVVTAALTDPQHIGQIYEVTGPRLLTFGEATAEIASATGRSIDYHTITPQDFMAGLRHEQTPEDLVQLINELFTVVLDGRNEYLGDGVQRALGREPRDFVQFARDGAAQGVWGD
ncbi:NmrA family NAD(P)-binding protein [Phyllobacterium sp. 21LDTY02-6]|uniref:NmrA family NAD(P)-binding protein n=1 Tax=Phyllobacterium sp. 21LDTY02-6 TaxID=2944903 RepID=UPI00202029D3|nr:NAD(P)H-binding protein [Phyllobacterium sp. 21LDTY02-6]MCO4319576.1 NmrA family NAD(P)-binding protein [Phyllobacterium sp. 21LDTY02-6]